MNKRCRYIRTKGGPLMLLSAWCRWCGCDTIPSRDGLCMFCDGRIVSRAVARAWVLAAGYEMVA